MDAYVRSSGAAWSAAARAYFRRATDDMPRGARFGHSSWTGRVGWEPSAEEQAARASLVRRGRQNRRAPLRGAAARRSWSTADPGTANPGTADPDQVSGRASAAGTDPAPRGTSETAADPGRPGSIGDRFRPAAPDDQGSMDSLLHRLRRRILGS